MSKLSCRTGHHGITAANGSRQFRTLKAAREAGYMEMRPGYYGGDQIVVKGRTLSRNPFRAKSRTEWLSLGYVVPDDVEPHGLRYRRYRSYYEVFRHDQVGARIEIVLRDAEIEAREAAEKVKMQAEEAKRKAADRERAQRAPEEALEWLMRSCSDCNPVKVPLLAALHAINRQAKRARDLARSGVFEAEEQKKKIYIVKGQALHWLFAENQLTVAGYHLFRHMGDWYQIWDHWAEVLQGDGYRFHRPCDVAAVPAEVRKSPNDYMIRDIDAQPPSATEPRLIDAYYSLQCYLAGRPLVSCYKWH